MSGSLETLRAFLDAHPVCALVEVVEAKGSTPREQGAWMLVAPDTIFGTIGGGQLEWMAIDEARSLLASASRRPSSAPSGHLLPRGEKNPHTTVCATFPALVTKRGAKRKRFFSPRGRRCPEGADEGRRDADDDRFLDIPLGPGIGQCCGGRVKLGIRLVDDSLHDDLLNEAAMQDAARPSVLVFGAGHVGHALAATLALLPVRATVVETRGDALSGLDDGVQTRLTPLPEETVQSAPPGTAFVILTHDHALDFLLAAEALKRGDAAYVGMIGSKTKRATFRRWFISEAGGTEAQFARLLCPIGGSTVHDKRPAVIAALAAAEIVTALLGSPRTTVLQAHAAEG